MAKRWIGIPAIEERRPSMIYAFAMHDHKAAVYTFADNEEDHETLANLVRTGDVVKLVYGVELQPDILTTVRISDGNLRIEHTNGQS